MYKHVRECSDCHLFAPHQQFLPNINSLQLLLGHWSLSILLYDSISVGFERMKANETVRTSDLIQFEI